RRRHAARPKPDRVGHPRGPRGGARVRPVSDGIHESSLIKPETSEYGISPFSQRDHVLGRTKGVFSRQKMGVFMAKKIWGLSFLLAFATCAFMTSKVQAKAIAYTFCVDDTTDTQPPVASDCPNDGTCSGNCSLRDAIEAANAAPSGSDTINIQAGNYVLSGSAGEDGNATGDLDIIQSVHIVGAGATTTF